MLNSLNEEFFKIAFDNIFVPSILIANPLNFKIERSGKLNGFFIILLIVPKIVFSFDDISDFNKLAFLFFSIKN